MNLKGLDKVLFSINWLGNVYPTEINIDPDSTFEKVTMLLDLGPVMIDARGVTSNPEHTPALIIHVDLESVGTDYIYYAIKLELVEYVELGRLGNRSCRAITWEQIKYDLYQKSNAGEQIESALYDLADIFVKDYYADNPE